MAGNESNGLRRSLSTESNKYNDLREALKSSSWTMPPRLAWNVSTLGFGFRCSFWVFMDVIQERLEREFTIDLIIYSTIGKYYVNTTDGDVEVLQPI